MAFQTEVGRCVACRIAADFVVLWIHSRSRVLPIVTAHAIGVFAIDGGAEVRVVTGNAIITVRRVRSALDGKRALRMGAAGGGSPSRGRVAVLTGGRKVRMSWERARIVVVLMTADTPRRRSCIDRRISDVTAIAGDSSMRPGQRPRVLEGSGGPGIATVTGAAGRRELIVRRAERLGEVGLVANQTI